MSLLVVGLSYRTAPLPLLERAALPADAARSLEAALVDSGGVTEAVALSTCNRLEIYAEVGKFHAGVAEVSRQVAERVGVQLGQLSDHLYVHYEGAAVDHLFHVVAGLDSMAIGEQQILGQVRAALRGAQAGGTVGRQLDQVLQQALRVGKRVHAETELDQAGRSLLEAGLDRAARVLGPLAGVRALVVGAGAMSGLAVAGLARAGVNDVSVVNRTPERARRLAASVGGRAVDFSGLPDALGEADLILSSTGATGHVIPAGAVARAGGRRNGRPQVFVDLAVPRDVPPEVAELPGVTVVDLEQLAHELAADGPAPGLDDVRSIIAGETAAFLAAQRAESVAPTVVALRAHARGVVEAELARLDSRLGDIDERLRAEVAQTVHRVVEKLLHTPTVRVKELAGGPDGAGYAQALRALFDLPAERVEAVFRPTSAGGGELR